MFRVSGGGVDRRSGDSTGVRPVVGSGPDKVTWSKRGGTEGWVLDAKEVQEL